MKNDLRILLVEDEVIAAMMLQTELGKHGLTNTRYVTTGEKAILSAREFQPDLILMDIRLAGRIDGIEAAREIKTALDVPILFMTGYDDQETRDRAGRIQPLAFLVKPLNFTTILEILETHFSYPGPLAEEA